MVFRCRWIGCIAHQLELVTVIAFERVDESKETIKKRSVTAALIAKLSRIALYLIQEVRIAGGQRTTCVKD